MFSSVPRLVLLFPTIRLLVLVGTAVTGDSGMDSHTGTSTVNSLSTRRSWPAKSLAASRSGGMGQFIATHYLHMRRYSSLSNQDHIPTYSLHEWQCEEGQCGGNDARTGEGKTARSDQTGHWVCRGSDIRAGTNWGKWRRLIVVCICRRWFGILSWYPNGPAVWQVTRNVDSLVYNLDTQSHYNYLYNYDLITTRPIWYDAWQETLDLIMLTTRSQLRFIMSKYNTTTTLSAIHHTWEALALRLSPVSVI